MNNSQRKDLEVLKKKNLQEVKKYKNFNYLI